mmetsp:Transcript_92162/g.260390  ORF Transcript_92162/g.260390 Transcript_92162/m.260390 type:complete len:176 (+) Transcript_92162:87-614(+)
MPRVMQRQPGLLRCFAFGLVVLASSSAFRTVADVFATLRGSKLRGNVFMLAASPKSLDHEDAQQAPAATTETMAPAQHLAQYAADWARSLFDECLSRAQACDPQILAASEALRLLRVVLESRDPMVDLTGVLDARELFRENRVSKVALALREELIYLDLALVSGDGRTVALFSAA